MTPINVLVVDDSVVVRRMVTSILDGDPDIRVVGTAPNGRIALDKVLQVAPDILTMDVEMPELDGIATVRELRKTHTSLPVVMFSTLTERSASATLDALAAGANDYVCKPANVGSVPEAMAAIREQLVPKIKALVPRRGVAPAPGVAPLARPAGRPLAGGGAPAPAPTGRIDVLAIGSSTGGPDALAAVVPALPASLAVPVVITQHMPPVFTRLFAQRLDAKSALRVKEAEEGDPVVPGTVLIAPGGLHLEVVRRGPSVVAHLTEAPPENFCRPAVDVMLRSVVATYGANVLSVVLTGMGSDGARGCEVVRQAGGEVVAQDEATSVVWGMPGAVTQGGHAHRVLPLPGIASDIIATIGRGRARTAGAA